MKNKLEALVYELEDMSALLFCFAERLEKTSRCSLDSKAAYSMHNSMERIVSDLSEMLEGV